MQVYLRLGQKIYRNHTVSGYRRMIVFIIRSLLNQGGMTKLRNFFEMDSLRREIATTTPYVFEQVTRCVFYRGSTFNERLRLIQGHFLFFEKMFSAKALKLMYIGEGIQLWTSEYCGEIITLQLRFDAGQKKEGLMGINLVFKNKVIYQLIFWIAPDKKGEMTIWIGALQGSLGGLGITRELTKHFSGYRPKNLVLQSLRSLSGQLGIHRIRAVSNYGFYANNHIRIDRKLKTSLDDFWEEVGGEICKDRRFYKLPVLESRKNLEEVQSKKRNLYRKRFAIIDMIDAEIKKILELHMQ